MTSASEPLLRLLIRQNEDALRELPASQPWDANSEAWHQHMRVVDDLRAQTIRLNAALDQLIRSPPPPRRRRTWRDLAPPLA